MYRQNKDLVLTAFFGFIYYAIVIGFTGHLTLIPLGEYFVFPFLIAFLTGMAITRSEQMLEWPLCFLFGGMLSSISILTFLILMGRNLSLYQALYTLSQTFAWFGSLSAICLVGILVGAFTKATYNIIWGSLKMPS